jgi:hypothetical protein
MILADVVMRPSADQNRAVVSGVLKHPALPAQ